MERIKLSTSSAIAKYIMGLSYADHGALNAYWMICERGKVNARHFIEHFPSTSRMFMIKHKLFSTFPGYHERRWRWARKIFVKLDDLGLISAQPIEPTIPSLAIQPGRKFSDADYIFHPIVSEIVFQFEPHGKIRILQDLVSVHKFLRAMLPRPHVRKRRMKKVFKAEQGRTGIVSVVFPIVKS